MASKIGIVIEREYRTRVYKWQFVVLTLLFPVLMLGFMALPTLLMEYTSDHQRVAVVDRTGLYGEVMKTTEAYQFDLVPDVTTMAQVRALLESDMPYTAVLEIRDDLSRDASAVSLYATQTLPPGVANHVSHCLSTYLSQARLAAHQIEGIEEIIRSSRVEITVPTYRVDASGMETQTDSEVASVISMIIAMAIYIFISIYGGMVLQGVMEEKKSRIMEVMVSSVRPFDLLMGKLLGIGLVGLTQILIWILLLTIGALVSSALYLDPAALEASSSVSALGGSGGVEPEMVHVLLGAMQRIDFVRLGVFSLLFFVGGYLLYAAVYAALGSTISSDEDAPQMPLPVTMLMLLAFYISFACAQDPGGALALWCSYIPLTSPMVMLARLPYGVELWEPILSVLILYGSFVGLTMVAAKIYRVGILMYGKKPSLRELARWLTKY